ncbi:MAG TPA: hypothetical protein VEJ86_11715 [Candidatus Binataceae bacterium]|nr:hypothetical protein [Candidatus Binataceae bacterium]
MADSRIPTKERETAAGVIAEKTPATSSNAGKVEITQRPTVTANGQIIWSTRDLLFPAGTRPAVVYRKKIAKTA